MLAGYGSDSSEEKAAPDSSEAEAEAAPDRRGQRYLATAKVLPPHIRAALEGRDDDDDDSDDDVYVAKGPVTKPPSRPTEGHELLAILPKVSTGPVKEEVPFFTLPAKTEPKSLPPPPPAKEIPNVAAPLLPTKMPQKEMTESRKRRAVEEALMEGDTSVLDGEVVDVAAHVDTRTPSQLAATSKFTSDVKVAAPFYDPRTGTNITTLRPSKLQRRRHQINSLAATVAERELQLIQQQNLTKNLKTQTRQKYGW